MKKQLALGLSLALLVVPLQAQAAIQPPTNISFERVTPEDVPRDDASSIVSWDDQADAVAYSVAAEADGQSASGTPANCNAGTCESTLSGLVGGLTYDIVVSVFDNTNSGQQDSESVAHTPHSSPKAPDPGSAVVASSGVTLSWTALSSAEAGGVALDNYKITDAGNFSQLVSPETNQVELTDLNEGQSYSFRVSAINQYGESTSNSFETVTTLSSPGAPVAPSITLNENTVSATWSAPTSTGGSELTGYRVYLLKDGSDSGSPEQVGSSITSYEFTDLSAGSYAVQVAAVSAVGTGSRSASSSTVSISSAAGGTTGGGAPAGGGGGGGAVGSAPSAISSPSIAGSSSVGSTLQINNGEWDSEGYEFSYQWYRCDGELESPTQLQVLIDCDLIQGATGETYEVTEADSDKHLLASITASAGFYSTPAYSNTIAPGETLEGEISAETDEPASDAATSTGYWTKRNGDNVKIYAKNIIGLGKVQFFVNGEEIAWIRAADRTDPKLRVITEGHMKGASYLVRDKDLSPGKNVFEIYLDGERIERRIASLN